MRTPSPAGGGVFVPASASACAMIRGDARTGMAGVDYSAFDDQTLIEYIVDGQADALSALYDRYSRLVYSLARHITGDDAHAEEITLDVFTRVWEKAGTYRAGRAKVNTWITSLARHRAIDVLRREQARPEGNSVGLDRVDYDLRSRQPNPENAAAGAIEQQWVREAIAELPEAQRQALSLAYYGGYTHQQIADKLSLPLGTVKTRIRLAMQKLRHALDDVVRE